MLCGGVFVLTGLTMFYYTDRQTSIWYILSALMMQGSGLALNNPTSLGVVTVRVPDRLLGAVSGFMSLIVTLANR